MSFFWIRPEGPLIYNNLVEVIGWDGVGLFQDRSVNLPGFLPAEETLPGLTGDYGYFFIIGESVAFPHPQMGDLYFIKKVLPVLKGPGVNNRGTGYTAVFYFYCPGSHVFVFLL